MAKSEIESNQAAKFASKEAVFQPPVLGDPMYISDKGGDPVAWNESEIMRLGTEGAILTDSEVLNIGQSEHPIERSADGDFRCRKRYSKPSSAACQSGLDPPSTPVNAYDSDPPCSKGKPAPQGHPRCFCMDKLVI
ncbi:hypothetical protein KMZ93_09610 [Bradyrhizobium sediminis]|uniref:Uncharacterized protein n=1 Tax=Bradyrhizobium sediminis TaxID=2840469 RepID=A0A975P1W3_9BRAD|nr:hypothetical protein [Bradyrhizobium sediminis]QWG25105.1 hypothetical protein KMZ93_09610 [Bradyrhizobium sediminis]